MRVILRAAEDFEKEANRIFLPFDTSRSARVFDAAKALSEISSLTSVQADFLRQSVRSVESGIYRGAIVMAFCAISDIAADLAVSEQASVKSVRSKWSFNSKDELLEQFPDSQVFDALKEAGVVTRTIQKTLHSLLHRRNQCAHPSAFQPGPDEALGYIRECMATLAALEPKGTSA